MSLAEQKALQSLAVLRSEVDALATQVEVVVRSAAIGIVPAQQQAALLHELMTQALLKLDLISGDGEVRTQRKAEVRRVNELSAQLDRAEQGAVSRSSPAPSSPQGTASSAPIQQSHEEFSVRDPEEPAGTKPQAAVVAPPAPSPQSAPQAEPSLVASSDSALPQPPLAASPPVFSPSPIAAPVSKAATVAPPPLAPPPAATTSSSPQPSTQRSPSRTNSPVTMAGPPPRQPGEDVRKRAAGMMSHALSFSDGIASIKPPPIEKKQSLASSAVAAFTAHQMAPKSTQTVPPLAPTISERLDNLSLSAAPAPAPSSSSVSHSGSIHDLDSFFGGPVAQAPPAVAAPQAAPPSVPNFANFDSVGPQQSSNTPPFSQSPAHTPPAPQSSARLIFPSPPKPAVPLNRNSTSGSPQEAPRPQRDAAKPPVLGNLSGFASPIPPPKPAVRESPPVSPAVSSFSPPLAALSSFSAEPPSPATRSTLTRPASQPNLPQTALPPPPASGMRRSVQASSIEEALRGALSRRESVGKETPPGSFNAKAEPLPPVKPESAPAPKTSPSAAPASSSSWVAFDSDFDPRGFSGSAKSSPTVSRRSSYELPPPPRPAQPLFPELATNGKPEEQGIAPAGSLLDDTSATAQPPATKPADAVPAPPVQPVAPAATSQAAPLEGPSSKQPQPVPPKAPAPSSQASFEVTFPNNFSAPQQTTQAASPQGAAPSNHGNAHVGVAQQGSVQPGFVPQASGVLQQQPRPPQQQRPPQQATPPSQGFAQQAFPQQQQSWGAAQPAPAAPPSTSSAEGALQSTSAPAGVRGSGPLEGFGETGRPQFARPPVQQAYGAPGWPQQGFATNPRPGFAGFPQQQGYNMAPGFNAGFGAQASPYLYRPPGAAPWLQQPGAGAGFRGFAPQPAGQAWPYAQQPQAAYQQSASTAPQFFQQGGGYGAAQQSDPPFSQSSGGVAPPQFPQQSGAMGLPQQAPNSTFPPAFGAPNGGYQAPPAASPAWSAGGSTAGQGGPPPAVLPPWMIQPQQPTNNGAQGQGW